eukprot:688418_1
MGNALGLIKDPLSDEEIERQKKKKVDEANRIAIRDIKHQRNLTLKQWIKTFKGAYDTYKHSCYWKFTNLNRVSDALKSQIDAKYHNFQTSAKSKLIKAMERNQSAKTDMFTIKVTGLKLEPSTQWSHVSSCLVYFVPETIPPSYDMQFVSIDLKNMEDEMRTQTMPNMHYEISQNSDLIFNHLTETGDTVMFIRGYDDDTKTQYVSVVASEQGRRTLACGSTIQRYPYNVQLVSFCESQSLFAILGDDKLSFAKFEGGARLRTTNKSCDLRELYWWNCLENKAFQAMFIQEINKNIFVWFIDAEG